MSIPVNARVRAVPNFLACLRGARAFMVEQDAKATLNKSVARGAVSIRDGLQGANRSHGGAMTRICNAADRPERGCDVRQGLVQRCPNSAPACFEKLQSDLVKARALLAFAPASGRPARFLDARTGWGQFQAQRALHLARELGMPELRAVVLSRHVVLYAHLEQTVALLALRHERRLRYPLSGPAA